MNTPVRCAALLGCLAVMLGAFGAHGLEGRVSEKAIEVWLTANRYHFFHALAVLAVGFAQGLGLRHTQWSLRFWSAGLMLFSGALYLYAITGLKFAAMVAPLGGLSFAAGWLCLLKTSFSPEED